LSIAHIERTRISRFFGPTAAKSRPLYALNRCLGLLGLATLVVDCPRFPAGLRPRHKPDRIEEPLVSVILPAQNTESLVETAVGSLLDQTWSNLEILAVDDASTDSTMEKLHRLASKDPRVLALSHSRNAGPCAARMTALAVAQGQFVTCHDPDDWAHPQRIERQVAPLLQQRCLMATFSDWVRMADYGTFYVRKSWPLIHHNPASVMFRREPVLDRMGGFDLVRAGADSEFCERLKVVFGAGAVRRTKGILAVGSHRTGSLINDPKIGVTNHVLSPSRLAYWKGWRHWHVESLRAGQSPFMPAAGARPFPAPAELWAA
jgi:glycosyltransferase involved in cell wall biosynthesis